MAMSKADQCSECPKCKLWLNNADLEEHSIRTWKCHKCDYEADESMKIDTHGMIYHGTLKSRKCVYQAEDRDIMRKHMERHTGNHNYNCGQFEFEATKQYLLKDHMAKKHRRHLVDNTLDSYICERCEKTFLDKLSLDYHSFSPQSYKYLCKYNQCDFIGTSVEDIIEHIIVVHRKTHFSM